MTPKELLYLEDCLGMERQLQTKCLDYSSKLQNPTLRGTVTQIASQHQTHFNNLMSQLNVSGSN